MKRCTAPCTGYISKEDYAKSVQHAIDFLKGKSASIITQLTQEMEQAVARLGFEEAARLRDQIQQLRIIQQSHSMKEWLALVSQRGISVHEANDGQDKYKLQFQALSQTLQCTHPIQSIVCFDVSHTRGEATYASAVSFNLQGPNRSAYRRFSITGVTPGDDYAALRQAIFRYYRLCESTGLPLPEILLIDGGKGQVQVAQEVLLQLQLTSTRLLGITKGLNRQARYDRIYDANALTFLNLLPHDDALHLLQQVRDEAHRFALSVHRKKRAKQQLASTLTQIEGIGPKRRKALLQYFGGLQALRVASFEALCQVPGISPTLATRILNHFH